LPLVKVVLRTFAVGLRQHPKDVEVLILYLTPARMSVAIQDLNEAVSGSYLDADLLIHTLLLLLDLLLKFLKRCSIGCCAIGFENLDISAEDISANVTLSWLKSSPLVGQRRYLLLLNLVIRIALLILLPIFPRCRGLYNLSAEGSGL
jgi:hypothetical protein